MLSYDKLKWGNSGRSPAFNDKVFIVFIEPCREFFLLQVNAQKPGLVLVLGKEPARFLSPLSDDLRGWKKEQSFTHMDAANKQQMRFILFKIYPLSG